MNLNKITSKNIKKFASHIIDLYDGDATKAENSLLKKISNAPFVVNQNNWHYIIDVLRELEGRKN